MKFFAALAILPALASAVTVSYDEVYDNGSRSLTTVACSDGSNGLIPRGFSTFGTLPSFPRIGGVPAITEWNSESCGTCWRLTYVNGRGVSRSINVLAIDVGRTGFNIGLGAMNELTNNQAVMLGRVNVTASIVADSNCGL